MDKGYLCGGYWYYDYQRSMWYDYQQFRQTATEPKQQIIGMILSVIGVIVFMVSRQPYAGMIFFVLLIIKGLLLFKAK